MSPPQKTTDDGATNAAGPSSANDHLVAVWRAFRAGGVAVCRRDGGPMALSVDGAAAAYRFVCVGCGFASPWFSSGPAGLRVHGIGTMSEPIAPSGDD